MFPDRLVCRIVKQLTKQKGGSNQRGIGTDKATSMRGTAGMQCTGVYYHIAEAYSRRITGDKIAACFFKISI